MSSYTSGSVNVTVGSSTVKGNGTSFTTYISAGDYFALNDTKTFYEIADIVDATELTLTSRYSDSDYQSTNSSEHIATTNTASLAYSDTLSYTPVIRNTVTVNASEVTWSDDGAGVLATTSGGNIGAAGTISYDDGAIVVNYNATPTASLNVNASYDYGNVLSAMPYRIVTDFTTNYGFPEAGDNETDLPRIITKGFRDIDDAIYNASVNTLTVSASNITIQGSKTPTNATSNGATGDICWDASYLYVCHSTNTWVRTSISSW